MIMLVKIESLLEDALLRIVRLESRLEHAGVLPQEPVNDLTRFSLENRIELPDSSRPEAISATFVEAVEKWLDAHDDEPRPSFLWLERAIGDDMFREQLITTLRFLWMQGLWTDVISKLDRGGPLRAGTLTAEPYKART